MLGFLLSPLNLARGVKIACLNTTELQQGICGVVENRFASEPAFRRFRDGVGRSWPVTQGSS